MSKLRKINDKEIRDFVIPVSVDYDCYDYFKARDPKVLEQNKEKHNNNDYLSFEELTRPKYCFKIKKAKFLDGFDRSNNGDMVSVYLNPTSREINEAKAESWNQSIRGTIQNQNIYCWRGDLLHIDMDDIIEDSDLNFIPTDGIRFAYGDKDNSWIFDLNSNYNFLEFFDIILNNSNKLDLFGDLNGRMSLFYGINAPINELKNFNLSELNNIGIDYSNERLSLINGIKTINEFNSIKNKQINGKLRKIKRLKIARLPILKDKYNTYEYEYIDIGLQQVNVDDIIGLSDTRVDEYNDDWTPKNPEDNRFKYQIELIDSGEEMQPIPLVKTPDGKYFPHGDGNHRVAAAHIKGLSSVLANVSVMVPADIDIDKKWKEYAKDKIDELNNMSDEYKKMSKELVEIQDSGSCTFEEFIELKDKLFDLGDRIQQYDSDLLEEEKQFKIDFLKQLGE